MASDRYKKNEKRLSRGLGTFNLKKILFTEISQRTKKKNSKLLEIGCGKGILLCQLRKKFPKNLELHGLNLKKNHGIQDREDFIANAREKGMQIKRKDAPYIHFGNATRIPFRDNSFDMIISQSTFLHIENKAKAIQEVYRVLKKDGLALISLGSYFFMFKNKRKFSEYYTRLEKSIGTDYNPRFLILNGDKNIKNTIQNNIKISQFIKDLKKSYEIRLWTKYYASKNQEQKRSWLILRKNKSQRLELNLRYLKNESLKMTELYGKDNPVNVGFIDVYELK